MDTGAVADAMASFYRNGNHFSSVADVSPLNNYVDTYYAKWGSWNSHVADVCHLNCM